MTDGKRALTHALKLLEARPVLCEGMTFPASAWGSDRNATIAAIRGQSSRPKALTEALGAWESLEVPPDGSIVPVGAWNQARQTAIGAIRHHLTTISSTEN